jgi:transposase
MDTPELAIETERLDDIPLLYGFLQEMGIQSAIDTVIQTHGHWSGLSMGWVVMIWLVHIVSEHNHCLDDVRGWVKDHLLILKHLTGQAVTELDFTDDRLAICLRELHRREHWQRIETLLGSGLVRAYGLKEESLVRLDATVAGVWHDPQKHPLFQVGKSKQGHYETQFKLMLASLDPLGLLLALDVVAGDRADDPLYVPSYKRVKTMLEKDGLLIVGDSKMSAMATRAAIVAGQDHYLTPLPHEKSEPGLLDELLAAFQAGKETTSLIFLTQDLGEDGTDPDPELAIAEGFEHNRRHTERVAGKEVDWQERCLLVRSFSYQKVVQAGLRKRLAKAEAALRQLTPQRGRGKRQFANEESLQQAIERIEKGYRVSGLFQARYTQEVSERQIRAYQDKPARTERKVRFQVQVTRNQEAIEQALEKAGWRIYLTSAPRSQLPLTAAVLAYRDQYIEENIFRRLKGKMLSITPVYVQRDDHAEGLFHLLSLAARLLALGDYRARCALAEQQAELSGVYAGNPKRSTPRPTMERMLRTFDNINLSIVHLPAQTISQVTPLSEVQERILSLLGLPTTLYTDWATV